MLKILPFASYFLPWVKSKGRTFQQWASWAGWSLCPEHPWASLSIPSSRLSQRHSLRLVGTARLEPGHPPPPLGRKEGEMAAATEKNRAGGPLEALVHLKLFTGAGTDFMGLKQRFCCCSFVLTLPCLRLRVELDLLFLTSFPTKTEKTTEGQAMSFASGFPGQLLLS